MSNIKVAVRVRPLSNRETEQNSESIIEINGDVVALTNLKVDPNNPYGDSRERVKHFSYDFCYNSTCKPDTPGYGSQEQIFQDLGTEVIQSAVEGYNACLFAYGQTSTGKTYTMTGTEDALGLIPRICEGLFAHVESTDDDQITFKVEISYLEIYNERVRDLLKPGSLNEKYTLKVREHPKEGPYVQDLSVHKVKNCTDLLGYLDKGNENRTTAATHMHEHSSRSHAIVTLVFTQALFEDDLPREIISKIHLVDLAGSERADTTSTLNYKGRLKEGANINKSLVTLGNVIKALAEHSLLSWTQMGSTQNITSSSGENNCHTPRDLGSPRRLQTVFIPYRDSVLTWLLRDSLGGNSKTIMISTVTPASKYYNETLSTLRYAQRAKNIVNKPRINEDSNVALIRQLQEEIKRLRQELANAQLPGSMGDLFYLIPDSQNLSAYSSDSDLQAGQKEKNAGTVVEKLQEKEYIAKQLTKSWKDKWSSANTMQDDDVLSFHELRRASSHGIILDSQIPHLIGMDDDILSTGVIIYQLHIGKVCIGTCDADTEQDIVLSGGGIEKEHCYVENDGDCVVFHPNPGCVCKINGTEVNEPTQLQQGDIIILGTNKTFRFNNPAEAARLREHRKGSISSVQNRDEVDGLLNVPKWEHQSNSAIPPFPMFNPNVELTKKYKTEAERIEQASRELKKVREELREKEKLLEETSEQTSHNHEERKNEVVEEKYKLKIAFEELHKKKVQLLKLQGEFADQLAEEQKHKRKIIEEIEKLIEKSEDTSEQCEDISNDATIRKRKLSREGRIKALAQEELVYKVSTIEKTKSLVLQEEELEEEEEILQVHQQKVRAREKDYKALSRSWTEELSSKKEEVDKLEAQEDQIQAYIQEKEDLIKVGMDKPNPIRASYSETHLPSADKPKDRSVYHKKLHKKVSPRKQHLEENYDERSSQSSKSSLQDSSPSSSKGKLYKKKLTPKKVCKITSSAEDITNRLYKKPVVVKHHNFLRKSSRHHLQDKPFRSPRDRTPLTTPAPQILHRPPKPIIHDPLKLKNFGGSDSNLSRPGLVRSRSRIRQIVSMSNLASVPEASYEAESEAESMHSAPDIPEAIGAVRLRNDLEPPMWERCSSMPTDGNFERAWENYSQSMGLKIESRTPDTSDNEQPNSVTASIPSDLHLVNMDFSRRKRASANRRKVVPLLTAATLSITDDYTSGTKTDDAIPDCNMEETSDVTPGDTSRNQGMLEERAEDSSRHSPNRGSYSGKENYILLGEYLNTDLEYGLDISDPCRGSETLTETGNTRMKSPREIDTYLGSPSLLEEHPSGSSVTASLSGNESDNFSDSLNGSFDDEKQENQDSDVIEHGISSNSPKNYSSENPSPKDNFKGQNPYKVKNTSKSMLKDQMSNLPKLGALSKTDSSQSPSTKFQQVHSKPTNLKYSHPSSPQLHTTKAYEEKISSLHKKSQPADGSKNEAKSVIKSLQHRKGNQDPNDRSMCDEESKPNKSSFSEEKNKSSEIEGFFPNVAIVPWQKVLKDDSLPHSLINITNTKSPKSEKNKTQHETLASHIPHELMKIIDDLHTDETLLHQNSKDGRENEESKINESKTHDSTKISLPSEDMPRPIKGKSKLKVTVKKAPNSKLNEESTREEPLHQLREGQTTVSGNSVNNDKRNSLDTNPEQPMESLTKSIPKKKLKITVRKSPKRDIPEYSESMSLNEDSSDETTQFKELLSEKETGTKRQPDSLPMKPVTVKFKSGSKKSRIKLADEYFVSSSDDSSLEPTVKLMSPEDSVIESSSESYEVSRSRSSSSAISDRELITDSEEWNSNGSSDATTGDFVGTHSLHESSFDQSHLSSHILGKQVDSDDINPTTGNVAGVHSASKSSLELSQLTSIGEDKTATGDVSAVHSRESPHEQSRLASNIYENQANSDEDNTVGDVSASHLPTESPFEQNQLASNNVEEQANTVEDNAISDVSAALSPTKSLTKKSQLTSNTFEKQANSVEGNATNSDIAGAHSLLQKIEVTSNLFKKQTNFGEENTTTGDVAGIHSLSESSLEESQISNLNKFEEQCIFHDANITSGESSVEQSQVPFNILRQSNFEKDNARTHLSSESFHDQGQLTAKTLQAEMNTESSMSRETMDDKNTKSKDNTNVSEDCTLMDHAGQMSMDQDRNRKVSSASIRTHNETLEPDNLLKWNQTQNSYPSFDEASSGSSVKSRQYNIIKRNINKEADEESKSENRRLEYDLDITNQPFAVSVKHEQNIDEQYSVIERQAETLAEDNEGTESKNIHDTNLSDNLLTPITQLSNILDKCEIQTAKNQTEKTSPNVNVKSNLVDSKRTALEFKSEGMETAENELEIKSDSKDKPYVSDNFKENSMTPDLSVKLSDSMHGENSEEMKAVDLEKYLQLRKLSYGKLDVHSSNISAKNLPTEHHRETLENDSMRLTYKQDMSLTKSMSEAGQNIDVSCLPTNNEQDILFTEKETKVPLGKFVEHNYTDVDPSDDKLSSSTEETEFDNTKPVDLNNQNTIGATQVSDSIRDTFVSRSDHNNKPMSDNDFDTSQLQQERNTEVKADLVILIEPKERKQSENELRNRNENEKNDNTTRMRNVEEKYNNSTKIRNVKEKHGNSTEIRNVEEKDNTIAEMRNEEEDDNITEMRNEEEDDNITEMRNEEDEDENLTGIKNVEEKDNNLTGIRNFEEKDNNSTRMRNVEEIDNCTGIKKGNDSIGSSDDHGDAEGITEEISTFTKSDCIPDINNKEKDDLPSGIFYTPTKSPNKLLLHHSQSVVPVFDESHHTERKSEQKEKQTTKVVSVGNSREQIEKSTPETENTDIDNDLDHDNSTLHKEGKLDNFCVDMCKQSSGHQVNETSNTCVDADELLTPTIHRKANTLPESKLDHSLSAIQPTVSADSQSLKSNNKPSGQLYRESLLSSDNSDLSDITVQNAESEFSNSVVDPDHLGEVTKTNTLSDEFEVTGMESDIRKVQDRINQEYFHFSYNGSKSKGNLADSKLNFGKLTDTQITQQQLHVLDEDNCPIDQCSVLDDEIILPSAQIQCENGQANSGNLLQDSEKVHVAVTNKDKPDTLSHSNEFLNSTLQENELEGDLVKTSETYFTVAENFNEISRIQKSGMVEYKTTENSTIQKSTSDNVLCHEHNLGGNADVSNTGESSGVLEALQIINKASTTGEYFERDAEKKYLKQSMNNTKETFSKKSDSVSDQFNTVESDKEQYISKPAITREEDNKAGKQMFAAQKQNQMHSEYQSEEEYGVDERGRDRKSSGRSPGNQHSDDSRGKEQTQSDYSDDSLAGRCDCGNKTSRKNTIDVSTNDTVVVKNKNNENNELTSGVIQEDSMVEELGLQSAVIKVDKTSSQMSNGSPTEQLGLKFTEHPSQPIQSSSSRRHKKRSSRHQKDLKADDTDAFSDDSLASGSNSKLFGKRRKRTRFSTDGSTNKADRSSDEYADSVNTCFSDDALTDERRRLITLSKGSTLKTSEIVDITKSITQPNSPLDNVSDNQDIMDDSMTQTEGGSVRMGISPISVWSSSDSGIQPLSGTEMSSCGIQTMINEGNSIKSSTRRAWNLSISAPHIWGSKQNVAASAAIEDSTLEEKPTQQSSFDNRGADALQETSLDVNHQTINTTLPIELETVQPSTVEYDVDGKIKYLVTINEDETKILYNVEKTEYRTYTISDDNTTRKSSHPIIPESIRINLTETKTLQTSENFETVQKERLVYEREGEERKDAIVSSTFYQEAKCVETEQQSENGIVTRENSVERQSVDSDNRSFIRCQMISPLQHETSMLEAQTFNEVDSSQENFRTFVYSSTDQSSSEREEHETSPSANEIISTDDDTTFSYGNFACDFISNGRRTLLVPTTTSTLIEVQRGSSTDSLSSQINHDNCHKLHQSQVQMVSSSEENMMSTYHNLADDQVTCHNEMKISNEDTPDVTRSASHEDSEDVDFDDGYSSVSTLGRQSSLLAYHPDIGEFVVSPSTDGNFSPNERNMSMSSVEKIVNIQSQTSSRKNAEDIEKLHDSFPNNNSVQASKTFHLTKESSVDPINLNIVEKYEEASENVYTDSLLKDDFTSSANTNFDIDAKYGDSASQLTGSRNETIDMINTELSNDKGDINEKLLDFPIVSTVENLIKPTEQKTTPSTELRENIDKSHISGNVTYETRKDSELTEPRPKTKAVQDDVTEPRPKTKAVQDDVTETFIHGYSSVARTILKPNRQGLSNPIQVKDFIESKTFQSTFDAPEEHRRLNVDKTQQNNELCPLNMSSNERYNVELDFFRKSLSHTQHSPRLIFDSADDIIRKLKCSKEIETSEIPAHQKIIDFFPSNIPSTNNDVIPRRQCLKHLQRKTEYLNEPNAKGKVDGCKYHENSNQSAITIGKIFLDAEENYALKDHEATKFNSLLERESRLDLLSPLSYLNKTHNCSVLKKSQGPAQLHNENGRKSEIYQQTSSKEIKPVKKAIDVSRMFLGQGMIDEETTVIDASEDKSFQLVEVNSKIIQFIHPPKTKVQSVGVSCINRSSSSSVFVMNLNVTGKNNQKHHQMESDQSGTEFEDSGFYTMTTTDSSLSPDNEEHKSRSTGFNFREHTRCALSTPHIKISNQIIKEEETSSITSSHEDYLEINEQSATQNRLKSEFSDAIHHEDSEIKIRNVGVKTDPLTEAKTTQKQYKTFSDGFGTLYSTSNSTSTSDGKASDLYSSDEVYLTAEGNGSGSSSSYYKTPFQSPRQIIDNSGQSMQDHNSYHMPIHSDSLPHTSTKYFKSGDLLEHSERTDSLQWEFTRRIVKLQSRIRSLSDSAISSDFTEQDTSPRRSINKNLSHSSELGSVSQITRYSLDELNRCLGNIFSSKSSSYKKASVDRLKEKRFISDLSNLLADLLLDNQHTTQSTEGIESLFNVNAPARLKGRKWRSLCDISELRGLEIIKLLRDDYQESRSHPTCNELKKTLPVTDLDVDSDYSEGGNNNMEKLKNSKDQVDISLLETNMKERKRLVRQKSPSMSELEIGEPVVKDFEKAHSTGCVDMLDSSSPNQSNSSSNDSITFVFVGDSEEKSDRRHSNPSVCRPTSNTSAGRKGMSESHLAMVISNFQEKVVLKKSSDKNMVGNRSVSSDNVSRNMTEELRRSYSTSLLDVVQIEEPDIEPFPPSSNEIDSVNDGGVSDDTTLKKQTKQREISTSIIDHSNTFSHSDEVDSHETSSFIEYSSYRKPLLVNSMVQTEQNEPQTQYQKEELHDVCEEQGDILSVGLSDESGILSDANMFSVSSTFQDLNNWNDRKLHGKTLSENEPYRVQTKTLVCNSTQTDETKSENLNLSNSETQTNLSPTPVPEAKSHSSAQVQTDGEKQNPNIQTGPTNRAIMAEIVEMKKEHGKMMELLKRKRERPSRFEILSSMKASMSDSSESISPVTVIHKSAETSPTSQKSKSQLVDDDTQTDINLSNSSDRLFLNSECDSKIDHHRSHDSSSELHSTSCHNRMDNLLDISGNGSELDKSLSDCLVYVPIGKDNKRYFVKPAEFRESLQKSLHTEEKSTETTTTRTATKSTGSLQEELDKLQRERIEIIDLLNLNYLPASLTVELLEAKLNHCIGQTDAILESLEDTWNDDDISYRPAPSVENITEITKEYIDKYRSEFKQSKKDFSVIKEEIVRKMSKGRGRRRSRTSDLIRMTRKAQIDAFKLERMREQQNYERIRSKSPLVTPPASPHHKSSNFNPHYLTPRQRIDHLVSLRKNIVESSEDFNDMHQKSFSPGYSERSSSPDYHMSYSPQRSSGMGDSNQQQLFSLHSPDVSFTLNISPPGSRFSSIESSNRSPERVAYISLPYQQFVAEVLDPALLLQESAEIRQRNHQEIARAHTSLQRAKTQHAQPPQPFRTSSPDIKHPCAVREYSPLTSNHGISKADIDKDIENLKQIQEMKATRSSAPDRSMSPTNSEASSTSMASYAAYAKDMLVRSERSIRHSTNRQSHFFERDCSPRPDTPSSIYSADLDSLPDSTSTPKGSRPITSQDIKSRIERRKTTEVKKKKCG